MIVKSGLDALGLVSAYDVFRRAPTVHLTVLFSPEHGFAAVAADRTIMMAIEAVGAKHTSVRYWAASHRVRILRH